MCADNEDTNLTAELTSASSFIRRVEQLGGRVLVHCIAGVSRSVTITVMHIMCVHNVRLRYAFDAVEALR